MTTLIKKINVTIRRHLFLSSFIFTCLVFLPASYLFVKYYTEELVGELIDKDPKVYIFEHSHDRERYYANFFFEKEQSAARVKIFKKTFDIAVKGDRYLFQRKIVFQTVWNDIFLILSIICFSFNFSLFGWLIIAQMDNFIDFCFNIYFSLKRIS